MHELAAEEGQIVDLVREWGEREVKPVVQDLEHSNTYPAKLIERSG
ncbi:hypothetical protein [Sinosporangium siamense]|uniref:Uncharacterized protein n=1 Tax=Sinosporangium siamense TaxID=1367973 RepID=A0A919V936_9ACTN|nr:hypothetical protein [Sinosporangium siamense]GII96780.1 hypothetical protein Ssi02_70110 [Sinosporangium siamense]